MFETNFDVTNRHIGLHKKFFGELPPNISGSYEPVNIQVKF